MLWYQKVVYYRQIWIYPTVTVLVVPIRINFRIVYYIVWAQSFVIPSNAQQSTRIGSQWWIGGRSCGKGESGSVYQRVPIVIDHFVPDLLFFCVRQMDAVLGIDNDSRTECIQFNLFIVDDRDYILVSRTPILVVKRWVQLRIENLLSVRRSPLSPNDMDVAKRVSIHKRREGGLFVVRQLSWADQ